VARQFANGGLNDSGEFFASNEHIIDFFSAYFEGRDPVDGFSEVDLKEAAQTLIIAINEQAAD
jgi:hypothetical protein